MLCHLAKKHRRRPLRRRRRCSSSLVRLLRARVRESGAQRDTTCSTEGIAAPVGGVRAELQHEIESSLAVQMQCMMTGKARGSLLELQPCCGIRSRACGSTEGLALDRSADRSASSCSNDHLGTTQCHRNRERPGEHMSGLPTRDPITMR